MIDFTGYGESFRADGKFGKCQIIVVEAVLSVKTVCVRGRVIFMISSKVLLAHCRLVLLLLLHGT